MQFVKKVQESRMNDKLKQYWRDQLKQWENETLNQEEKERKQKKYLIETKSIASL